MRGPDGDVARYRQIVLPVLTFVIMPVADLSAAITVADLGIPHHMSHQVLGVRFPLWFKIRFGCGTM